jgi:hypothetical protein
MAYLSTRAAWQRVGIYHACEGATWGVPVTASSGWYWLRELSNVNPTPANPKNPPAFLGTGKGYDEFDHFTQGVNIMKPMSTRHPLTPFAWRDGFALFAQNNDDATHAWWLDTGGTGISVSKAATLVTKSCTDTDTVSGLNIMHRGVSCIINQLGLSIPTSGEATITYGWIGQTAQVLDHNASGANLGTPSADSAEALQGQSCTFSMATAGVTPPTAVNGFCSAEITLTNGGTLGSCNASGLPACANLGRSNVTGTVTVLDMGQDSTQAYTALMTAWEANADAAASEVILEWGWSSNTTALIVPVVITDRSDPQDIGGALAYTFTFKYAGGDANYPVWRAVTPTLTASPYYA